MNEEPLLRVMALHALAYCERLFYLEEVEEIRVADAAVFDGRRAHDALPASDLTRFVLEAPGIGLKGRVDAVRREDGALVPVETKKGKSAPGNGREAAWRTDRIQVVAYALILEEALGVEIGEAKVRYLADHKTVSIPVDGDARQEVRAAIERARELRVATLRPPVTANERLCPKCSLSAVCLPEEERVAAGGKEQALRLLPAHQDRIVVHVSEPGARVGRSGDQLAVKFPDETHCEYPIHRVGSLVIHGYAQVSSQAIGLCSQHDVQVHWLSGGGLLVGSLAPTAASAQRHIRQFTALVDGAVRLRLARILVAAKVEHQLRFLLRATRTGGRSAEEEAAVGRLRSALSGVHRAAEVPVLLGHEGEAAAAYFSAFAFLVKEDVNQRMRFTARTRHPSRDRFSAVLNFAYGLLYRECLSAILAVGLHPGFGFYHLPRGAAHPLALDVMEVFRVPIVDMAVIAAINRQTFDVADDFEERGKSVWLTSTGRKKTIELFERRKADEWRHPVIGYSLSYARLIELEVRLLEKEWSGEGKLFARFRLR